MIAIVALSLAAATVTPAAGTDGSPAPSPFDVAGPSIVFQSLQGSGDGIFTMDPDGSDVRALLPDLGDSAYHPDWSPDGSRIAFEVAADAGVDVWTSAPDGTDLTMVIDHTLCPGDCVEVATPAWSPDGRAIAYYRLRADETSIRFSIEVMDLGTGRMTLLAEAPPSVAYLYPRWCPDGRTIVFQATHYTTETLDEGTQTGSTLHLLDVDAPGAISPPLTEAALFAAYPDCRALDGTIVFTTRDLVEFPGPDETSNLYTVLPDGSGLTQVTSYGPGDQRAGQPTWTPDGERIVFVLTGGPLRHDVPPRAAFIDADGGGLVVLDPAATHPRLRPSSPD
jgi:Tol biopolymer transport system component